MPVVQVRDPVVVHQDNAVRVRQLPSGHVGNAVVVGKSGFTESWPPWPCIRSGG
jgi:hypothetical protein